MMCDMWIGAASITQLCADSWRLTVIVFGIVLSVAFWMVGAGFVQYLIYRTDPDAGVNFGVFLCSLLFWPIVPGILAAKKLFNP